MSMGDLFDSGPQKAIALAVQAIVPIPGIGLIVGLAISLANRGKDEDLENTKVMANAALNGVLSPLANATLAHDYDAAVSYLPKPPYDLGYYYDVSLDVAPAMTNAYYAAALGYALTHDDPTYFLQIANQVDRSEGQAQRDAVGYGDASE